MSDGLSVAESLSAVAAVRSRHLVVVAHSTAETTQASVDTGARTRDHDRQQQEHNAQGLSGVRTFVVTRAD